MSQENRWQTMSTQDVWKSVKEMTDQMEKYQLTELMSAIHGHIGFRPIAERLARAGLPGIGVAALLQDKELIAIPGITMKEVQVVRVTWFYMTGDGTKGQIDHEIERLQRTISAMVRQMEVLAQRVEVLGNRRNALMTRRGQKK